MIRFAITLVKETQTQGTRAMPYKLTNNDSGRTLPNNATGLDLLRCKRGDSESIEFANGGSVAELWLGFPSGKYKIIAVWEYDWQ